MSSSDNSSWVLFWTTNRHQHLHIAGVLEHDTFLPFPLSAQVKNKCGLAHVEGEREEQGHLPQDPTLGGGGQVYKYLI
jgi:hypothetical protein